VPATRREAAIKCVLSGVLVEVERLRIELTSEGLDLVRVDRVRPAHEALSQVELVEIKDV